MVNFNNTVYTFKARIIPYFVSFLDYCVNYLNFPNNYMREIGQFQKHYEEVKRDFYTLKEFKKFIKYVDNVIYRCFFEFMFYFDLLTFFLLG